VLNTFKKESKKLPLKKKFMPGHLSFFGYSLVCIIATVVPNWGFSIFHNTDWGQEVGRRGHLKNHYSATEMRDSSSFSGQSK